MTATSRPAEVAARQTDDVNLAGVESDQISGNFSVHVQRPDGGIYDLTGVFTAPICVVISPV